MGVERENILFTFSHLVQFLSMTMPCFGCHSDGRELDIDSSCDIMGFQVIYFIQQISPALIALFESLDKLFGKAVGGCR